MSSYTTTATITGVAQVRPNPTGGPDTHLSYVVEVARNTLETNAADVVRITVITPTVEAGAYLTPAHAEELAAALLAAAGLDPDQPQPDPIPAGGIGSLAVVPTFTATRVADRALRQVQRAVTDAIDAGALRSELLLRVANGITGSVNGPVERQLARAFDDAVAAEVDR